MALKNNLKKKASEGLKNAAERLYDDEFSFDNIKRHYNDNADPSTEDENIQRARRMDGNDTEGSDSSDYDDGDDNIRNDNSQENIKGQEEAGDDDYFVDRNGDEQKKTSRNNFGTWLKNWTQNYGPTASIFGAITGGGTILFSIFLIPAGLTTALDQIMTNDASDSTRMNVLMHRAFVSAALGKADCSSKLKCRFSTMDKTQVDKWKAAGFTIQPDTPDADGRYRVTSITFPDGTTATNSRDFFAHSDNNLSARQSVSNVIDSRSGPYNSKYAKYKKVLTKYGLAKNKVFSASTDRDKDARTRAMNDNIDTHTDAETERNPETRAKNFQERLDKNKIFDTNISSRVNQIVGGKTIDKVAYAADGAAAACMVYNFIKASTAGVKLLLYKDLIAFAFPFFQTFAQVIDQGNVEPEKVEYIMDRLTWYYKDEFQDLYQELYGSYNSKENPENPESWKNEIGLTATDSRGIRAMISGNVEALKTYSDNYMGWKAAGAVAGSEVLGIIEGAAGGKENLRDVCFGASVVSFALTAQCAVSVANASFCGSLFIANALFGDEIAKTAGALLIAPALVVVANMNLTSHLKGVRLGDALAAGISLLLADQARGSGLTAAVSVAAVKKFVNETDDVYHKETVELARYEASQKPFDTSNQYSFINQLASSFNVGRNYHEKQTVFSNITNMFAIAGTPIRLLSGGTAGAMLTQPTQLGISADERTAYVQCPDDDIRGIGALCDGVSGKTIGIAPEGVVEALNAQVNGTRDTIIETVTYMRTHGYIDEEGKALGDTNPDGPDGDDEGEGDNVKDEDKHKYEYIKFKNYCTEDRIDPVGLTTKTLESAKSDKDREWWVYARCIGKDANGKDKNDQRLKDNLFYFSIYYNLCETQLSIAAERPNCWDTSVQPLASVTPNSGDWVIPTSGQCMSPYGQRWGRPHQGIDISPPSGTPVVAPTSMKITGVIGGFGGGYGTNVTATATDGTKFGFRFAHMIEGSPTVKVGDEVSAGQQIGQVGSTGDSTGPHLHFETFPSGGTSGAVDPVPVLAQNGVSISCG